MILEQAINVKQSIRIECDNCHSEFKRTLKLVKSSRKKRKSEHDYCQACSYIVSAYKKPQCSKEYWENEEVKNKHSEAIKNSEEYKNAIKNRDQFGIKNSMFGKKHKSESIAKMILKRTGKKQSIETIEKRRKSCKIIFNKRRKLFNVNKGIRGYLNREIHWYKRIYERDGFKCTKCNSTKKLDAHHIKPLDSIIKELTFNKTFINIEEKYNYLITCPEIIDSNLENGITLCRNCHKDVHYNWGSHNIKIKNE